MAKKFTSGLETLPFGKYKNAPLSKVPTDYIRWLISKAEDPSFFYGGWLKSGKNLEMLKAKLFDIPRPPTYTLAADQKKAADEIIQSLFSQDHSIHRLQGAAGYGKSFTAMDIVIRAKKQHRCEVMAAATSYVATQNLAKDLNPLGVQCRTIASLLRLDVVYDGPKEIYTPGADTYEVLPSILSSGHLLIIDEYSMVDDTVGQLLIDAAAQYGGKLLVIGDAGQLPSPAQDHDSILCDTTPVSTLTIPKRYSPDSALFHVEQLARKDPFNLNLTPDDKEIFSAETYFDLLNQYVTVYKENPKESTLMLWYRRKDMEQSNRAIRQHLFGANSPEICAGENLRVQRTSDYISGKMREPTRFYSGTTLRVKTAEETASSIHLPEIRPEPFVIPTTLIYTEDNPTLPIATLFSITENKASPDSRGGQKFNAALGEIATWCAENSNWKPYRHFRNHFVQIAYQYASTVHRVQGQSVDNVFASPDALRRASPYQAAKLLYVGLTRAKKRLTVL